ncbi:hypothetical protein [Kitasatospora griseola]|uniref:hypothetical protein n=1 Tax=Kitasatospora griseola TaxID=2064 RepID=UPI003660AC1A
MPTFPTKPVHLTAGTVTEIEWLDPNRPHTTPDERGCPDCGELAYDSGCEADGCSGWACSDCGTGCDLDFLDVDEGGQCAAATDED